jgi:hypothetical protein
VPEQIVVLPEIVPGCAGRGLTVTDKVCIKEEPQALSADTVIFPLVFPAIALIVFVVEVPVHPEGNVHVYDVAPLTGFTV